MWNVGYLGSVIPKTLLTERVIASRFKGYRDFTVQDIVITTKNMRYRLAHWQTPDGRHLMGKLPKELQGRHFGPNLVAHILYQHPHCHVTQPLLHEQLLGPASLTTPLSH